MTEEEIELLNARDEIAKLREKLSAAIGYMEEARRHLEYGSTKEVLAMILTAGRTRARQVMRATS